MDEELKRYLDANFARIDERFEEVEKRLEERIEKLETSLLTGFYGWARPMELRVSGVTNLAMGFEERLALAEQRISQLERNRAS
jgi:exonuclease VII small subunit